MAEWYVFAILAGLISGLVPITEKKVLKDLPVIEFSAFFSLINMILVLPLVYLVGDQIKQIPLNTLGLMFVGTAFASIGFINIVKCVKRAPVSSVSPLINFNPAVLATLSYFILGEQLSIQHVGGIGLIVAGAYIMEIEHHITDVLAPIRKMVHSKLIHIIMFSGVMYAIAAMIDKVVLSGGSILGFVSTHQVPILPYIVIVHVFVFIHFFIMVLYKHYSLKKLEVDFEHSFKWVFISSVLAVSYRMLQAQAVSLAYVSLVIPVKRLDTLVSTIIGGEMFHEKHLKQKVISAIVMLFGVFLIVTG